LENIQGWPVSTLRLIFLFKIMLFMAQSYPFSCQAIQNVPYRPEKLPIWLQNKAWQNV
jgi:hypothetical protein